VSAFTEVRRAPQVPCNCVTGWLSICRRDELINAGLRLRNVAPARTGWALPTRFILSKTVYLL